MELQDRICKFHIHRLEINQNFIPIKDTASPDASETISNVLIL